MKRDEAREKIQIVARHTPQFVYLTAHARLRDPQAGKPPLTRQEIIATLANGNVTENPVPDISTGGWRFKVTRALDLHIFQVVGVLISPDTDDTGDKIMVITGYEVKPTALRRTQARNMRDIDWQ